MNKILDYKFKYTKNKGIDTIRNLQHPSNYSKFNFDNKHFGNEIYTYSNFIALTRNEFETDGYFSLQISDKIFEFNIENYSKKYIWYIPKISQSIEDDIKHYQDLIKKSELEVWNDNIETKGDPNLTTILGISSREKEIALLINDNVFEKWKNLNKLSISIKNNGQFQNYEGYKKILIDAIKKFNNCILSGDIIIDLDDFTLEGVCEIKNIIIKGETKIITSKINSKKIGEITNSTITHSDISASKISIFDSTINNAKQIKCAEEFILSDQSRIEAISKKIVANSISILKKSLIENVDVITANKIELEEYASLILSTSISSDFLIKIINNSKLSKIKNLYISNLHVSSSVVTSLLNIIKINGELNLINSSLVDGDNLIIQNNFGEKIIIDNSYITGDSILSGNVLIKGAEISSNSTLFGNAKIESSIEEGRNIRISGYTKIFEKSKIFGKCNISGFVNVYGESEVGDESTVYGKVNILDDSRVSGKAELFDDEIVNKYEERYK